MGRRNMNPDTSLFAIVSGVETSTYTEFEEMFNRRGPETQLSEDLDGSKMELQPRGKHIGD